MLLPLLKSPKDSLEMPQRHTVAVGNRAWICHLPDGGRKRQQCSESSGWPVIFPCSLNPFTVSRPVCFYFHTEEYMCSACSGQFRRWITEKWSGWQGSRQSIKKHPSNMFSTWGFAGRSIQVHTSRQDVHLCYLSLHCLILSCVSITTLQHWGENISPAPRPHQSSLLIFQLGQSDSE